MWTDEKPANPGFYAVCLSYGNGDFSQIWIHEIVEYDDELHVLCRDHVFGEGDFEELCSALFDDLLWWPESISLPPFPNERK